VPKLINYKDAEGNKWVFNFRRKTVKFCEFRVSIGNEFHSAGAATAKDLCPNLRFEGFDTSKFWSWDRNERVGLYKVIESRK
jgi:hypothetical protein